MEEKKETRKRVLAARDAIPARERELRSAQACRMLERYLEERLAENIPLACDDTLTCGAFVVGVYSAMKSEVSLSAFADAAFARGWHVCFPCMVKEASEASEASEALTVSTRSRTCMEFFLVSRSQMERACKAFLSHPLRSFAGEELERQGFRCVAPHEIDAVVVPMVAFDAHNNRLGYGGGNYDRFLPQLREGAVVVGVAFKEQKIPAVPLEPHDLPLPFIVQA